MILFFLYTSYWQKCTSNQYDEQVVNLSPDKEIDLHSEGKEFSFHSDTLLPLTLPTGLAILMISF